MKIFSLLLPIILLVSACSKSGKDVVADYCGCYDNLLEADSISKDMIQRVTDSCSADYKTKYSEKLAGDTKLADEVTANEFMLDELQKKVDEKYAKQVITISLWNLTKAYKQDPAIESEYKQRKVRMIGLYTSKAEDSDGTAKIVILGYNNEDGKDKVMDGLSVYGGKAICSMANKEKMTDLINSDDKGYYSLVTIEGELTDIDKEKYNIGYGVSIMFYETIIKNAKIIEVEKVNILEIKE